MSAEIKVYTSVAAAAKAWGVPKSECHEDPDPDSACIWHGGRKPEDDRVLLGWVAVKEPKQ